jgi:hypothetical protein
VDAIELNGQTIVELSLVDSLHVRNWSLNGFAFISSMSFFSVPFFLESLLVGVEVPGVVLITGLESKTIVELFCVNGLVMGNWSLNGFAFISSMSFFSVPFFLESFLVGDEVPGVVLITGLESKTIIELFCVNGLVMGYWSLNGFTLISSLSLFSVPFFFESLLVGDEISGVVLIACLKSHTVP